VPKIPVTTIVLDGELLEVRFSYRVLVAAEKAYGKNIIREVLFGGGLGFPGVACVVWAAVNLQHPSKNLKLEQVQDLLEELPDGVLGLSAKIGEAVLALAIGSKLGEEPKDDAKKDDGAGGESAHKDPSPKN
jgi:hypothetical protein